MLLFRNIKKLFVFVFAAVLVVFCCIWFINNPGPEHIEDTNGPDNYSLQQITEADVVANEMGATGGLTKTESGLKLGGIGISNGKKFSCKKFTGVQRLYAATIFKGSDIYVHLSDFQIQSGNFAFYIVLDGEIVGEIKSDDFSTAEFTLEDIPETGTVEYYIAGESAAFQFTTTEDWYS